MRYSNSLENYCNHPISTANLKSMDTILAERGKAYALWCSRLNLCAVLVAAFGVLWVLCNGFSISFVLCACFGGLSYFFGGFFVYNKSPHFGVILKIQGLDYSSDKGFHEEVEMPDEKAVASPLAKSLILAIKAQDRKMRDFEKQIVDQLCAF